MAGFLKRWMIDCSFDDEPVSRDPRAWRATQKGGDYAQELRDISQRLRDEAPMDLEWPERHLRRRTLDALRECYIRRQRRRYKRWSFNVTISPRLATTLATCIVLAGSASLIIHQGGPELFDSVRSAFTQPQHVAGTGQGKTSSSRMAGVLIDDGDSEAIVRDTQDTSRTARGLKMPGDENEPVRADLSDTDSLRNKPSGDLP